MCSITHKSPQLSRLESRFPWVHSQGSSFLARVAVGSRVMSESNLGGGVAPSHSSSLLQDGMASLAEPAALGVITVVAEVVDRASAHRLKGFRLDSSHFH